MSPQLKRIQLMQRTRHLKDFPILLDVAACIIASVNVASYLVAGLTRKRRKGSASSKYEGEHRLRRGKILAQVHGRKSCIPLQCSFANVDKC